MKLAIIHYNSLELYPPALNFLSYLSDNKFLDEKIYVYTTEKSDKKKKYSIQRANIVVKYWNSVIELDAFPLKLVKYFVFYALTLYNLVRVRPTSILYYETLSSFPAIIYKKIFNRSCKIIAHYHEYMTIREYEEGSKMIKWVWKFEKKNFPIINVISHTNSMRMAFFQKDYPNLVFAKTLILPNYPPKTWLSSVKKENRKTNTPIRLVYVGSIDLDSMYFKEICKWIVLQNEQVTLDIYPGHVTPKIENYLKRISSQVISLKSYVNYNDLPNVLKNYDIGLILYKATIPNVIYCAPNKLFEYLSCGLDVWFPQELKGSYEYISTNNSPLVLSIDFADNNSIDQSYRQCLNISNKCFEKKEFNYFSEDVYSLLSNEIA